MLSGRLLETLSDIETVCLPYCCHRCYDKDDWHRWWTQELVRGRWITFDSRKQPIDAGFSGTIRIRPKLNISAEIIHLA